MKRLLPVVLLLGLLVGCAPKTSPTLTVMVHDSFSISEDVAAAFEQENKIKLVFVKSGDAGSMVSRAVISSKAPQADLMYGVDNTFLSRALQGGIFEAYESPLLAGIPDEFKLDPTFQAVPVDYGDVCLNYDKAWFAEKGLPLPASLEDLLKPDYNGLLVVENPATSSPGLAFLMASVAHFGPDGWQDYWKNLRANGLTVVNDWNTAYYTNFSGSAGQGPQPLVVSYASSPAAEVYFAETPPAEAPTGSIVAAGTCFRQVEFAGILKGTPNRALAEKFVDFILSTTFQEDVPLQMFVYPVNPQARLPEVFVQHSKIPQQPASLPPAEISTNREAWIQSWTEIVLR